MTDEAREVWLASNIRPVTRNYVWRRQQKDQAA